MPGPDDVVVEVMACGVCGSDLHIQQDPTGFVKTTALAGYTPMVFDPEAGVCLGHEFSGRVVEIGSAVQHLTVGDHVAQGALLRGTELHALGFSNTVPGGLSDYIVLSAALTQKLPEGCDPVSAALAEPFAVGLSSVRQGRMGDGRAAIVLGCGPIGLATICALVTEGVETIIASDPISARRALAASVGATVIVDPAERSPFAIWRTAHAAVTPTVFNTVGAPGFLNQMITDLPVGARIVQTGLHNGLEEFNPLMAIYKQLELKFVLGYTQEEMTEAIARIADGSFPAARLVTARVGLDQAAVAFEALQAAGPHAKIIIDPRIDRP
ncbi:alcohol dehydrogenase catalytic domain-containing protein [Nocardia sp. CA-136227]|uniref:alcohol dehydrogenase catalytic domain-containing protein n=1 Tax=Nocardia sp. CA-136227 TaxID=3239979 RepID=UPI003D984CF8